MAASLKGGMRLLAANMRTTTLKQLAPAMSVRHFRANQPAFAEAINHHVNTPWNNADTLWDFTKENYDKINEIVKKYPPNYKRSAVMAVLFLAQKQCEQMPEHGSTGWIPLAAMNKIAKVLDMPEMRVYEVATFYTMYNRTKIGVHNIQVCTTSPCMVRGAYEIVDAVKAHLNIDVGETTEDGLFHLMEAECLGACVNAPMMQIAGPVCNDAYYEDLTAESAISIIEQLRKGETPKKGSQIGRHGSIGPQGKTGLLSEPVGIVCRDLDAC
mmetsp:Transcript_5052/g.10085  ORF Transcript_5052/g.10085 Transcript_5052/m.10085 type:complete len:270 (+) Transcript_5052:3-812(+)